MTKDRLSEAERKVLEWLPDWQDGYYDFASIMEHTNLSWTEVRDACRTLRLKGLAEYARALFTEDGLPAGSGYCAAPGARSALQSNKG